MHTIKAVLFDFDGTISTLRAGWEEVMRPFMKESITGLHALSMEQEAALNQEIDAYIDHSTGIQTIYQMKWLAHTVHEKGWNERVLSEWEYKAEYNRRLLERVTDRIGKLRKGELQPEDFLIRGAAEFVRELHRRGVELYVASGTDHPDVVQEAEVLGLASFFNEIAGAPVGRAECSKEKVLRELIETKGLTGEELAVIGDGKVEIQLGKEAGGLALGLASNEELREGMNPVKERRLRTAGADWISGDFGNPQAWFERLGV
ncbi:HAD family hydrolase [Paenibacillus montanisoli]|uniref:HAD family hydrolase n=1 Tax=Paenibacillus montanisoli TaxID=2081970 RepID=A0A328U452_9BACL|nr:HAD family hydrolase [Paenibacillus montanisoli]RAP76593.1 HAD family hydrolase [Paenibacillus montanisoli]